MSLHVVLWLFAVTVLSTLANPSVVAHSLDSPQPPSSSSSATVLASAVLVSCNKHNLPQDYWTRMRRIVQHELLPAAMSPQCNSSPSSSSVGTVEEREHTHGVCRLDAFLWLGDVVYADTPVLPGYWVATPLLEIHAKYIAQRHNTQYQGFLDATVRVPTPEHVLGVWDDHDFGMNDGGAEYADKDGVQQMFLDFLDEPTASIRRKRKGLYSFRTITFIQDDSPASIHADQAYEFAFCIILLDVRYFREPFTAARVNDMLGDAQWRWLDEILQYVSGVSNTVPPEAFEEGVHHRVHGKTSQRCASVLIGGGIQFLMDEKPTEHWGNFPKSRDRLLSMLRHRGVQRVVFLSGDVHLGEIGRDASDDAVSILGYPTVELTSSGLTHSAASIPLIPMWFKEMFPSPRRVGVYLGRNFGSISLEAIAASSSASSGHTPSPGIEAGSSSDSLTLVLRVHKLDGEHAASDMAISATNSTVLEHRVLLSDLEYRSHIRSFDNSHHGGGGHPRITSYPDSEPGAIKRILMATQRYVFPSAKFHQLINLYVFGALLAIAVALLLALRVMWSLGKRCWNGRGRKKID
ncbi:PhoD-like phosphatase, putative [Bodo saltans]|uniref:PhoD-like phosphatase, putative n=1 Tax=Bodo saltans TaxID=75058 RepID=A0A0S4JKY7_BODSA|nr:PhoD-like phosphatase, putative [Bodo saltans]|eukprot:CUG89847.1 PhoD-like phosphatase, putative [Bodo saltans]